MSLVVARVVIDGNTIWVRDAESLTDGQRINVSLRSAAETMLFVRTSPTHCEEKKTQSYIRLMQCIGLNVG